MITKEQLIKLAGNGILYAGHVKDSKGNPAKARLNGKIKLWKTRPDDFSQPMKYGIKQCFYLEPGNVHKWFITEEEAKCSNQC